jgi:hypothetical protein
MANKKNVWGMVVAGLVFGLTLNSCTSLINAASGEQEVETETSKQFKDAAIDLVLSQNGKVLIDTLTALLERQFSGMQLGGCGGGVFQFTYQEKKYQMKYNLVTEKTTGVKMNEYVVGIKSCTELQKKEAK